MRRARWLAGGSGLVRRLGLDPNPLRRPIDRIATCLAAQLLVAFMVGAPLLSITAVGWAGRAAAAEQRAEHSWREVSAVLLQAAPTSTGFAAGLFSYSWVPARWIAPERQVRTGEIAVSTGLAAGHAIPIWVDATGLPTGPPLSRHAVVAREVTAAFIAIVVLAITLLTLALAGRWVLDRRRLANWDAAWADVGPHWTRRFWSRG